MHTIIYDTYLNNKILIFNKFNNFKFKLYSEMKLFILLGSSFSVININNKIITYFYF